MVPEHQLGTPSPYSRISLIVVLGESRGSTPVTSFRVSLQSFMPLRQPIMTIRHAWLWPTVKRRWSIITGKPAMLPANNGRPESHVPSHAGGHGCLSPKTKRRK